jgi:Asp/Glu/hydantoin racemase
LISSVVTPSRISASTLLRGGEQRAFARLARGAHGRDDAAAGARDLVVACAGQPELELVRPIAAIDDVGVAIDQARRDPATLAVDSLGGVETRRVGRRAT